MKTRVLLVDDHRLFREGIKALAAGRPELEIIGEAGNGRDAVALAAELEPDLVVMDVTMPTLNGIEAARQIREHSPGARILALTAHSEKRMVAQMLRAGASGYALKEGSFEELVEAMSAVAAGRLYLGAQVADGFIADYAALAENAEDPPRFGLTDRELEVLQRLAEGKSSKEIAFELGLSAKTVESHRQGVMDKMGIHSIAGLTRFALREGLTPE